MYELLGLSLALAALLTLNALVSLLCALVWRMAHWRLQTWPASAQARLLFALRVFPGLIALFCVAALLLPAYVALEPRHETEDVSLKLGMLAALSAVGLLLAAWRGMAA